MRVKKDKQKSHEKNLKNTFKKRMRFKIEGKARFKSHILQKRIQRNKANASSLIANFATEVNI